MEVGAPKHERPARLADVRAVEQEADVRSLSVPAALFQAVGDGFQQVRKQLRHSSIHRRISSLVVVPCGMASSFFFQWPLCPAAPPAGGFNTVKKATRSISS